MAKWVPMAALAAVAGTLNASTGETVGADGIIVTVPGCVVQPSDVLGWWTGDHGLVASIGPDLVGTVAIADGLIGDGYSMDGSNSVTAPGLGAPTTAVTVEMWFKPTFSQLTQTLASRWAFPSQDDSARSYALMLIGNDLIWMTDETSGRRPEELRLSLPQIFDGEFHHVAATWDQNEFKLYLDGLPVGARVSQGGTLNPAVTTPFRLGTKAGLGDPFYFTGVIDEPSVIRRALTAAEVEEMVGAGPNGKCVFSIATGVVGPGMQVNADVGGVDPIISPDGRYVLFRTRSTDVFPVVNTAAAQTPGVDLDLFDNYRDDLVLLDTQGTSSTVDDARELVSVNSNELGGELDSFLASMTPNASHVVFTSISNDLVIGDTLAGRDVFIRNRVNSTTERVSVRSDGSQPVYTATGLNNDSRSPSVNDSGTVIAFESTNRNLAPETNPVPGDTWQTYDIYVRDISDPNPANRTTERITFGLGDTKANGSSSTPIVSPDGRYVWFSSSASNLVAGDSNGHMDVFVHDRQTDTTTRFDLTAATGQPLDGDAYLADVSPDGRWLAFSSNASTIIPNDANGQFDAFRLDTQTATVRLVSPPFFPLSDGPSFANSITDDGRFVFFQSQATNLVGDDTNTRTDVFVGDLTTNSTQRVSLELNGLERNGTSQSASGSADGNSVVYMFQAVGSGLFTIWRSDLELP